MPRICRRFFVISPIILLRPKNLAHVSDEQIKSRFEIVGIEHVDRLLPKDAASPCISDIAGNWEWGTSITLWSRFKPSDKIVYAQVYRPLTNEWFNRYFLMLRSRFRIGEL